MVRRCGAWLGAVLTSLAVAGCGRAPAPPAGTGAREAAQGYYDTLVRQDWAGAYAALHPDSQKCHGLEQFGRLARQYRGALGLEPRAAHVRACEERGDDAVAHVTLTGRGPARHGQYRDAVALRRGPARWGVVLPPGFGRVRQR